MNDDLSSMIEQALQYASPLPVNNVEVTSGTTIPQNDSSQSDSDILQLSDDITKTSSSYNTDTNEEKASAGNSLLHGRRVTITTVDRAVSNDRPGGKFIDLEPVSLDLDQRYRNEADSLFLSPAITNINSPQYDTDFLNCPLSANSSTGPEHTDSSSVSSSICSPSEIPSTQVTKVKKTRRRTKNPDPPPEPILPPCSVCDEKSSGFHYGANTCEACKGFFRRTLKKQEVRYKCKCKPDVRGEWKRGPVKNGCASCRYERCVKVGMSKNAIKIGRYTIKHKTENINQVKSVESIDNLIDVAMATMSENSPSSSSCLDFSISSPDDVTSSSSASESVVSPRCQLVSDDFSPQTKKAKTRRMSKVASQNDLISLEEIESIVKTLCEANKGVHFDEINRCVPIEVIKQRQTEYLEKYNIKKELFGDMGLSKEEFVEFYNITGIDLDGRIQHVDSAFTFFETKISFIVGFAKSIPGFKSLTLNDQANLIKASRTENIFLGGYRGILRTFDVERRILTTPWGKEIHMDELARIVPINFILAKYKYATLVRDLDFTNQEESVIRAIVTMLSDRCTLEEPHKVERIQMKLVACLQHLLDSRPGGRGNRLYKFFDLITNFRDFSEDETEFTKSMLKDWPMLSTNKYQLLKEFLT